MKEALRIFWKWLTLWLRGGPHFVVGNPGSPYMLRWWILPRNPLFNIYLHKIVRDDDDRALHDHPWASTSLILRGAYVEVTPGNPVMDFDTGTTFIGPQCRKRYTFGSVIRRSAGYPHRIELLQGKPCWSLFITGSRVREWGFYCPKGWVPWQEFVDQNDKGNVGKGCGEMS